MKILVYSGPEELKHEYLKVVEVDRQEQVLGLNVVGVYPDSRLGPCYTSDIRLYLDIKRRIFSRTIS